jgi:hypothetical protein
LVARAINVHERSKSFRVDHDNVTPADLNES